MDAVQCPLCERYIADGHIARPGEAAYRFVVRYDLDGAQVCTHCDKEMGPDLARIGAMELSPNAQELIENYLRVFA